MRTNRLEERQRRGAAALLLAKRKALAAEIALMPHRLRDLGLWITAAKMDSGPLKEIGYEIERVIEKEAPHARLS